MRTKHIDLETAQTAQELFAAERLLRSKPHHDFDIERIIAQLLFLSFAVPRWQVWNWYPIVRQVHLITRIHKKCCGLEDM